MKILLVSASPYLKLRLGRICSTLLEYFSKQENIEIKAAVFSHDIQYFKPDNNIYYYKKNNEKICQLFPLYNEINRVTPQFYQIYNHYKPDVILSVSDYNEVDFIYALKKLIPEKFKWVGVLACDAVPINQSRKDVIKIMDQVISLNTDTYTEIEKITKLNYYIPFGIDSKFWNNENRVKNIKPRVLLCGKNSQSTGIATAIIQAGKRGSNQCQYVVHTNIDEKGDYDLKYLAKSKNANIKFPEKFNTLKDSISDQELRDLYKSCDVFVDLSMRSATGVSAIQAISCGCVPLLNNNGGLKDVLDAINHNFRYKISNCLFVGQLEQQYYVADIQNYQIQLGCVLNQINDDAKRKNYSKDLKSVAAHFNLQNFLTKIKDICLNVKIKQQEIQIFQF